ncbi:MAG: DUF262 domain-containing protein [Chitinispirillia bacterium]|nr:DUF262 domain-containing protein [Chitinispirillia bacterium]
MRGRSRIELLEDKSFEEMDINEQPPPDVFAFSESRSCADLFRMYDQGSLDIQPEFQRDVVWENAHKTRFIDSLIKQLPIPSLCFSYDPQQQKWLVIDGLQRISTIISFLKGESWILAKIRDVESDIAGVSAADIRHDDKLNAYYRRVENSTIPITVLRCNYKDKRHLSYLFTIFHRLNSTGLKLNNQEIRNCIYSGPFNRMLQDLDLYSNWRKLNKMHGTNSYRMRKQELILRFFAFYYSVEDYTGNLASFLNDFMAEHRFLSNEMIDTNKKLFMETTDILYHALFKDNMKLKISITVQDAICFAIARNIDMLKGQDINMIGDNIQKILKADEFTENALAEGLAKKQRVIERMEKACQLMR